MIQNKQVGTCLIQKNLEKKKNAFEKKEFFSYTVICDLYLEHKKPS